MGHLLSRLINHLTQYSNSRNQLPSADERQQQQHQQESSADVGSSIEADRVDGEVMTSRGVELTSQVNEAEPAGQDKENTENHESQSVTIGQRQEDKNKPAVEEAAIKIQALFRGHLTRKALKDAQQQEINKALKQSQQNGVTDETVNCK